MNIPLKDCQDIIDQIQSMREDKRIDKGRGNNVKSTSLTRYREASTSIVSQAEKHGYLSEKQAAYLKGIVMDYQHIQRINARYEPEFREEVLSFLENIIQYAETRGNGLSSNQVRDRAEQIRDDEYFWGAHFDSTQRLLTALRRKGVKTGTLEKRLVQFKRKTTGV